MSKNGGSAYIYDSKEDRFREAMELPYVNLFLTMPRSVFHKFYYKRSDATSASNSDTIQQHDLFGWEFHIGYQNDISVMEMYRRHGDPMTTEELEAIMESVARAKGSKWKRVTYVPVNRKWDVEFKNGELKIADPDPDGKKPLREILPENPNRFIYVTVPEDVEEIQPVEVDDIEKPMRDVVAGCDGLHRVLHAGVCPVVYVVVQPEFL